MKLTMRYWIITALSFLSFLAEAQSADKQLAEKLLEREIAFFVSDSDQEKATLLMEKAALYTAKADYKKALYEIERAEEFAGNDNAVLKYQRMLNCFLSDQYSRSAFVSLTKEELLRIGKEKEYFTMRFYSLNETGQWLQCRSELLSYCSMCDSIVTGRIKELPVSYDHVSPLRCRILSDIVPGLGMAKAGKPLKGVTSFLLQAGLALGTGYCFYSGYYVTGIASGFFPLLKFHKGGNRLSGILAEERNEKEKNKLKELYAEEIKKIIRP